LVAAGRDAGVEGRDWSRGVCVTVYGSSLSLTRPRLFKEGQGRIDLVEQALDLLALLRSEIFLLEAIGQLLLLRK
jgi:hypothetical protein